MQQLLTRRGFFDGEIDGKIGAATRAGVKKAQMKLGLPGRFLSDAGACSIGCAERGDKRKKARQFPMRASKAEAIGAIAWIVGALIENEPARSCA